MTDSAPLIYFKVWRFLGLAFIISVVYLSLTSDPVAMPEIKMGDKLSHLLAYGTLMAWFGQLYTSRAQQCGWFVGFCCLGALLEVLQGLGGNRYFEYADMLANAAGAALGWWLTRGWFAGVLVRFERLFFVAA